MATLSTMGQLVRRHDPDRFLTALFASPERRETLFVLYAFNHELARAREVAREPMAALIRLQWWREVVEGKRVRHEVAGPLGEALDAGRLDGVVLAGMIDAREAETETVPDVAAFEAYVLGIAGGVMVAAAGALGDAAPERLRPAGAAYGVTGVLRAVPALARQGRCVLPDDVLRAAGSSAAEVGAGGAVPLQARLRVEALARAWLDRVPSVGRHALPAILPAAYARMALGRGGKGALGSRAAVLLAAVTGRI